MLELLTGLSLLVVVAMAVAGVNTIVEDIKRGH